MGSDPVTLEANSMQC